MKIVVIGGTGLIGSKVVAKLKQKGHEALAASPNTGVNTVTGEGLAEALAGAQVVVDVANSPSFEDRAAMDFFTAAGKNLAAAEAAAGVKHHVALSVVGTDRLQDSGYFRAKLAQERLIKGSPIPYTLDPRDPVLRVHSQHRAGGHHGRHSAAVARPVPADRGGRCRDLGRRGRTRGPPRTTWPRSAAPTRSTSTNWSAGFSPTTRIRGTSSAIQRHSTPM